MSGVLAGFFIVWTLIAIGWIAGRTGILGPQGRYVLNRATFFLASPALVLVGLLGFVPGITTNFGDTAAGSVDETSAPGNAEADPYAKFNAAVAKTTAEAYEGPMAKLGGGPDAVAAKIETALTTSRPRPRYTVTASAKLAMTQRRLVSDRMWDRLMTSQFTRPGR